MIDASAEPYEKNVEIVKRVVDAAHAKGIVVEAELGQLGGVEEHVNVSEEKAKLTDPDQAKDFVERTGCDSLAVAIGTSHGAFNFQGSQSLHFDVLSEIQKNLPGFPLVMHGSSSVPQEEVERINKAGGKLLGAKGVDATQFRKAATLGVDQDQHRHRWPFGLDARPPRILPGAPGRLRPALPRQDLHGRIRQIHRPEERLPRQLRTSGRTAQTGFIAQPQL